MNRRVFLSSVLVISYELTRLLANASSFTPDNTIMSGHKLSDQEIESALNTLQGWTVKDGKLCKDFQFRNFAEALGWMVNVGVQAEALGHHPEWFNAYSLVKVSLLTYDLGHVISNLDVELAKIMDKTANTIKK